MQCHWVPFKPAPLGWQFPSSPPNQLCPSNSRYQIPQTATVRWQATATGNLGGVRASTPVADVSAAERDRLRLLQYLERIHVEDEGQRARLSSQDENPRTGPDALAALRTVHRQHYSTIPFENLSIFAKEEIRLDVDSIFDKLVARRRGGFCYEHNQLLGWALARMGYALTTLEARVVPPGGEPGAKFDHMCLLVHLEDGDWLADVGFGRSPPEPLLFQPGARQVQGCDIYQIIFAEAAAPGGGGGGGGAEGPAFLVQEWATSPDGKRAQEVSLGGRATPGEWKSIYQFSIQPHTVDEFLEMCRYQQTSPDSHFTQKRVVTRPGPGGEGRATLSGRKLTVHDKYGAKLEERELAPGAEYSLALEEYFGIRMADIDEKPRLAES